MTVNWRVGRQKAESALVQSFQSIGLHLSTRHSTCRFSLWNWHSLALFFRENCKERQTQGLGHKDRRGSYSLFYNYILVGWKDLGNAYREGECGRRWGKRWLALRAVTRLPKSSSRCCLACSSTARGYSDCTRRRFFTGSNACKQHIGWDDKTGWNWEIRNRIDARG